MRMGERREEGRREGERREEGGRERGRSVGGEGGREVMS